MNELKVILTVEIIYKNQIAKQSQLKLRNQWYQK